EAAADVLDVLVDAEDLLDDEDDGEGAALVGHGPVAGHHAVLGGDLDLAGFEALGVGGDGLGGDRLHGHGEAGGERGDDELAAADFGQQAEQVFFHGGCSL